MLSVSVLIIALPPALPLRPAQSLAPWRSIEPGIFVCLFVSNVARSEGIKANFKFDPAEAENPADANVLLSILTIFRGLKRPKSRRNGRRKNGLCSLSFVPTVARLIGGRLPPAKQLMERTCCAPQGSR